MARQVVPLLYGAGMDRATGIFSREGRAGYDLRNVYLYRDKLMVRKGHSQVNLLVDEVGTELEAGILVSPMSAEQIGLVAGYGSDGRVHLFRVDGDGTGLSEIGIAFTVSAAEIAGGAHTPPRLFAAEQYAKIFVAHNEAIRLFRHQTCYYDPYGPTALNFLTADLDGDSVSGPVYFRGVSPYLTYVLGWGFGTESDPDRPEVVRVSDAEDPTLWAPDDYFIAGTGGSPVLNCLPAGTPDNSCVLVLKPTEIHQIFGYDKLTFGIRQIEQGHGLAASRLAYALNGVVYFWDLEGPRRSSGGPSEDLAWPLNLDAPSPADLVAEGISADAFACYLPSRRCILFVFGQRIYVLNLWDAQNLKWSYGTLPWKAQAGGVLYTGAQTPTVAPTGNASNVDLALHLGDTDNEIDCTFVNNGLTGGEVAEVWGHQVTPDLWSLIGQGAASGPSQTIVCAVQPGTLYEAQVRYRRGPHYGTGYTGSPSTWPAISLSVNQVQTTITAPSLTSWWRRTSATTQRGVLKWTASSAVPSQVYRNGVLITTIPAGTPTPAGATGVLAVPYFGADADDRRLAYDGCNYVISGAPLTLAPGNAVFPGANIPAGRWGAFQVTVDATTTPTVVAAAANGTGYASETAALAALPAVPANAILLQKISVQAQAGNQWRPGNDAVEGGTSGNPAQRTCWYPVDPIAAAGELAYTDDAADGTDYAIVIAGADASASSGAAPPTGFPVSVAVLGALTTCGGDTYNAAWTNNGRDLVRLTHVLNTGPETEDLRTLEAAATYAVPGAVAGDLLQVRTYHVQRHFGVDDFSGANAWAPVNISAVPC